MYRRVLQINRMRDDILEYGDVRLELMNAMYSVK